MNAAEKKAFVAAFLDIVWTRGDVSEVERFLAPRYTIRSDPGDPWDGRTLTREEFAERLTISRAPFPDQVFIVDEMIADEAGVAVAWRWEGTHLADLPGFPASGRKVKTSGLTFYSFEDGKLSGHRQQTDRLGVFQQLARS
ncbi:MAG: ester cyclase [Parvularculaceae bacterium]|nr:ester cyclase [Amphiplicatus sp.]MCB9955670.1 ester cyclase [Caulobacterales bacterium]